MREHGRSWMVAIVAAGALLLGAAGCAKKEPIREAEAMADAICKCKDFECALEARKVGTARLAKWKDARGTEDEAKQVGAALARSESCDQKLRATAAPAPAPAAPGAEPAPAAPAPAPGSTPAAPAGASK
jgi:hypothetical protein